MTRFLTTTALMLAPAVAQADVPNVVTDIAPVHGLTAMVMGSLGEPELIIAQGESPHHFSMRPSQARALSDADLVLWIGEGLSPQLHDPIESLANTAHVIELSNLSGVEVLEYRTHAIFDEAHDDGHDDHAEGKDHDGHDHDEQHDDHGDHDGHDDHAKHDDHDDHAHEEDGHNHLHDGPDSHMWLSPDNAQVWLKAIAAELAELDPDNAEVYRQNATNAVARVEESREQARIALTPVHDLPIAVAHDAFQYFDHSFDLNIVGAISDMDDAAPGPARLAELKAEFTALAPTCFIAEPGFDLRLVQAATEGTTTPKSVEISPIGSGIPLGQDFYPALITQVASKFASCAE